MDITQNRVPKNLCTFSTARIPDCVCVWVVRTHHVPGRTFGPHWCDFEFVFSGNKYHNKTKHTMRKISTAIILCNCLVLQRIFHQSRRTNIKQSCIEDSVSFNVHGKCKALYERQRATCTISAVEIFRNLQIQFKNSYLIPRGVSRSIKINQNFE